MTFPAEHARDNPWWRDPSAIERDPDLRRLRAQPARYDHPIPFSMDLDAVYTLRGPRQVGKSTLLKRIALGLLDDRGIGARDLFFLDAEAMAVETASELREAAEGFLDWSRSASPGTRKYLLLDEVTGVSDWGSAVRVLHRRGLLDDVTAIVTGSHALDLKEGGETAPGRRGEEHGVELDWVMMPFGFRDFVLAHEPDLEDELPAMDALEPRVAHEVAAELGLLAERVRPLFDRYLLAGGYPHAMAAEATKDRIPGSIYDLCRHAVTGQVKRAGHRESYFRELVAWAADRGLGHEFSWRDGSGETRIGSKDTVRRYLEDAEAMYLWHIVYRAHSATDPARALRSPKKLYPSDPFGWHVLANWGGRRRDPWSASHDRLEDPAVRGTLVESVVADHLVRGYGDAVRYHRSRQGREEIDFLVSDDPAITYLEVKFRERIRREDGKWLGKYGGGILATSETLDWDADRGVASVPVWALLAGYAEPVSLYPALD